MFHDGRVAGLAAQALDPLRSFEEMRGAGFALAAIGPELESRLGAVAEYAVAFEAVYGSGAVTLERAADALATFQTTLIANEAPFDRWMRGDADAMSEAELDGLDEFVAAGCADCHSGPMFSDFRTHVLGVEGASGLAEPDAGDGGFAFRTPSLRQLRFTAPYFHAGQRATLGDVIDFYDRPRRSRDPNVVDGELDPELLDVPGMGGGRGAAILRFLDALNDDDFDRRVPASVPSGLPVGGSL